METYPIGDFYSSDIRSPPKHLVEMQIHGNRVDCCHASTPPTPPPPRKEGKHRLLL